MFFEIKKYILSLLVFLSHLLLFLAPTQTPDLRLKIIFNKRWSQCFLKSLVSFPLNLSTTTTPPSTFLTLIFSWLRFGKLIKNTKQLLNHSYYKVKHWLLLTTILKWIPFNMKMCNKSLLMLSNNLIHS